MLELSTALVIEIVATIANLLFLILLIKERISCWFFGIIGSLLSVYLFSDAKLYWEAVLYLFYAAMGIWGWLRWYTRSQEDGNPVTRWQQRLHWWAILCASVVALAMGYGMQTFSDAERPLIDAFTTSFSFLATYLEITKVLEAWLYWIVLNVTSIWLYQDRELHIYAVLMVLYSAMSVWGLFRWYKAYNLQLESNVIDSH